MHFLLAACLFASIPQDPPAADPQDAPRPAPMQLPRSGVLRLGKGRIVVDGSLQEWPALPPIGLDDVRQVSGTALGAFRSLDDLAGRLFLTWDDEDLYLSATVLDDWHLALREDSPRTSEIPPADSLVVTFDPFRDTRAYGSDPGRSEDAEFWLADVPGQERRVVRWDRLRGSAGFVDGGAAVVTHDPEAHRTTYEARIPWREILPAGRKPEAGRVLDVQFVLNDYDEPTDSMPQTRIGWNFGMGPRIDPWLLGSVVLLDQVAGDAPPDGVRIPEIPPPPEPSEPAGPDEAYWIGLKARMDRNPAVPVTRDLPDVTFAGGKERHDALLEFDRQLAGFPRVDFIEFQQRIDRRMNRECAGIVMNGIPYFWDNALDGLARRVTADPPASGFRIHRLPQGGFLVRSSVANFAIDPAGFGVDHRLFEAIDFVLLTRPLELAERNDQLLLRMVAAKPRKPVYTQLPVHLPGVDVREFPLVVPGQSYEERGLKIRVLGRREDDGRVSPGVAYHVEWPDGTDLVVSGTELDEATVRANGPVEALLLSARHGTARIVGQRIAADLAILDDVLECSAYPGASGRISLQEAWQLQDGLRPHRSVVLAPAESIDVPPHGS